MLRPGDTIERYTVESLIGTGGTAVVYRVRHTTLGTRHALKVLSVQSDIIRRRMLTEGKVQAQLRHPNVVAVTDVITAEDDAPALIMEYIKGPTLDKALQKYKINQQAAEDLFLGIAAGTVEAHRHGLVHRDLKPANVMLARTEEGFLPKVTDFGLAKVLSYDEATTGHTRAGVALGTPAYMAPEQVRDAATVDQRADVFALGCILYELLTHRRAFPGEDTIAVYNQILDGRYVPPRHFVPEIPDRLDSAIKGALVVDREQRIPDMLTMMAIVRGEQEFHVPELYLPKDEAIKLTLDELESMGDAPDLRIVVTQTEGDFEDEGERDPLLRSIVDPVMQRGSLPAGSRPRLESERDPDAPPPSQGDRTNAWFLGLSVALFLATMMVGVLAAALYLVVAEEPIDPTPVMVIAPPAQSVPLTVEPEPAPEPAAEAPTSAPKPAPAPVATSVTVKLLSSPPTAQLTVDGTSRGRTPAKLDLAPGTHSVEIASGDQSGTFQISVSKGAANKWCYSFAAEMSVEGSCR